MKRKQRCTKLKYFIFVYSHIGIAAASGVCTWAPLVCLVPVPLLGDDASSRGSRFSSRLPTTVLLASGWRKVQNPSSDNNLNSH